VATGASANRSFCPSLGFALLLCELYFKRVKVEAKKGLWALIISWEESVKLLKGGNAGGS
jgi:hypothetical protein